MDFEYLTYTSTPESPIAQGISDLHHTIFGDSADSLREMGRKPQLLIHVAKEGGKVIGYKIGYELDERTFYSWLGGVDPAYRGSGIAAALMERQHEYIKGKGYHKVQTKTMNKWRNMLILNLKHGFDIVETYIDSKGAHKILLEKTLLDEG